MCEVCKVVCEIMSEVCVRSVQIVCEMREVREAVCEVCDVV